MFEDRNLAAARQQELIDAAARSAPHTTRNGRAQRRWWQR